MRIVKLVLAKPNITWRAHEFCLDKKHRETKTFDFNALDSFVKRMVIRAQDAFQVIKIVDVDDPLPDCVISPLEIHRHPTSIDSVIIEDKSEPQIDLLEPTEVEEGVAWLVLKKRTIADIKAAVKELPKTIENKRVILSMMNIEKSKKKPRKTLVSFLEEAFLEIPEGA